MSPTGTQGTAHGPALRVFGAWLVASLVLHLTWEIAQLPLYTLWHEEPPAYIAWAVVHCTAGDGLIALGTYAVASVSLRSVRWPRESPGRGLAVLWASGFAWTAFSEWRHVRVLGSSAYAGSMPTLAGIGLGPLAQWVIVPGLALWCLREWHPVRARASASPPSGDEDRIR
jgi:hypothetical protein